MKIHPILVILLLLFSGCREQKTIDELVEELNSGKRSSISPEEIELAREYTRSQLPSNLRFPREGDVYEAINDFTVHYMTHHFAPYTGGGKALLPKGERVRVDSVSDERPISVYCDPLRYDELHESIVPKEERNGEAYAGYYFSIDTVDLNKHFRLVQDPGAAGDAQQ